MPSLFRLYPPTTVKILLYLQIIGFLKIKIPVSKEQDYEITFIVHFHSFLNAPSEAEQALGVY